MEDSTIDHLISDMYVISRILIRRVYSKTDEYLRSVRLCRPQLYILRLLKDKRELSMGKISEILQVSPPTVIPWIDKLVAMGYVSRDRSKSDRRFVRVRISKAGEKSFAMHSQRTHEIMKNTLSKLSDEELTALSRNFDSIKDIISELDDSFQHQSKAPG